MYIIIDSKEHVNKMISSQTMTKEELYNMGACDYDSVYMSEVRTAWFTRYFTTCLKFLKKRVVVCHGGK